MKNVSLTIEKLRERANLAHFEASANCRVGGYQSESIRPLRILVEQALRARTPLHKYIAFCAGDAGFTPLMLASMSLNVDEDEFGLWHMCGR